MLLSRAMRKRCSSIAEFRQPLKTLKSVGPRSSINGLPRAAKMARVCQLQEGEVIEGQSVFSAPPECSKNERPIEGDENKVAVDNQSVTQTPYSEVLEINQTYCYSQINKRIMSVYCKSSLKKMFDIYLPSVLCATLLTMG